VDETIYVTYCKPTQGDSQQPLTGVPEGKLCQGLCDKCLDNARYWTSVGVGKCPATLQANEGDTSVPRTPQRARPRRTKSTKSDCARANSKNKLRAKRRGGQRPGQQRTLLSQ
jgi:hypothetical protein